MSTKADHAVTAPNLKIISLSPWTRLRPLLRIPLNLDGSDYGSWGSSHREFGVRMSGGLSNGILEFVLQIGEVWYVVKRH